MHIPTPIASATIATIAESTPTPTVTNTGDCFVCGDPSDTILITQALTLLAICILYLIFSILEVQLSRTLRKTFITFFILLYLALTIHASLKFFLDDFATTHDDEGKRGFWRGFIYGVTKGLSIFGIGQMWLMIVAVVWVVMRCRKFGPYKEVEDEVEDEDENGEGSVGEMTPLLDEQRRDGERIKRSGPDERRFIVLLKGRWWDGGGADYLPNSVRRYFEARRALRSE